MSPVVQQQLGTLDLDDLKQRWGDSYEARMEAIRRTFGNLSPEDMNEIEEALGTRKFLESAGKLVEHLGGPLFDAPVLDAETARDALLGHAHAEELRADPKFMEKFGDGDLGARDQLRRARDLAYPVVTDEPVPGPLPDAADRSRGTLLGTEEGE